MSLWGSRFFISNSSWERGKSSAGVSTIPFMSKAMNHEAISNKVAHSQNGELKCPNCGKGNVRTTETEDTFTYGKGPDAVNLTTTVPLRTCLDCHFQFLDGDAEDAHHEAICRHLGVMTPSEIQALRCSYQLSRRFCPNHPPGGGFVGPLGARRIDSKRRLRPTSLPAHV